MADIPVSRIYLSPPHMGGAEQKYVNMAFNTNWIAPLGPNVDNFEKDLCRYTGAAHAAVLNSGTSALHLALVLLGVGQGDVVLCQSMTFAASANPVAYQGAISVFIDSEPDTWNMCHVQLEKAIAASIKGELEIKGRGMIKAQKPKAIIPVHLYGMPAKTEEILEVALKYNIPVIEDAAESLGSTYNGRQTGTFGTMAVLSFNGNKIITTSGGGALLSDDEQLIRKARFLATQARDNAPHYEHSEIGYNYRMSNVLAGIGRGQMEILDQRVRRRREINKIYREMLKNVEAISFPEEPAGHFSNYWLTTILVEPEKCGGITREDIRLALEKGFIEARPLWKPLHLQPVYSGYPFFGTGISNLLFEKGLCLPSGSSLTEDDFKRIRSVLKSVIDL
jgi:dTDP-4-amino-4,6-dideoxygalactose transaminase